MLIALLLTSCTKLHKEGGAAQIRCAAVRKGEAAIANHCMNCASVARLFASKQLMLSNRRILSELPNTP